MRKIAIIGAGNMGGAIARGLERTTYFAKNISISDVSESTLETFRKLSNEWTLTHSNEEAIKNADIIILAVKPWLVEKSPMKS